MQPLVTIAIPTVSRFSYLKEAVNSGLAQTYENVEVLIGDDGSSDAIRDWSHNLANKDRRVRYHRNSEALGLAGNWNSLVDLARGDYIVIIGDDDRLLPQFVEQLLALIDASISVVFANHYLIDANGRRLQKESIECTQRYKRDKLPAGILADASVSVWQNSIPMSAALVRTADLKKLRFKEELNTPEIEMFARLAQESGPFVFTPEYLSEYRVHGSSATAAGLHSEKLVGYLAGIAVSRVVEPYKRDFMEALLVEAVGRSLKQKKPSTARNLLRHEYYPRSRILPFCIQALCANLPVPIGSNAYRVLSWLKNA